MVGVWVCFLVLGDAALPEEEALPGKAAASGFQERFAREIWPTFKAGGEKSCLSCHAEEGMTPLLLFGEPASTFKSLLGGGYFDPENPVGLLARLTSPDPEVRMPPAPAPALDEKTIEVVRKFLLEIFDLQAAKRESGREFPAALLEPWPGGGAEPPRGDNVFLTYTQLRGKVISIFGDDWQRGEKDLFQENLAQFGGADFRRAFNESQKATATFLSALDRLAADVASRAFLERTGPFGGLPGALPHPEEGEAGACEEAIGHLFRRILFRGPTGEEMAAARAFLAGIYRSAGELALRSSELTFELTVRGEEGLSTTRGFTIPVESSPDGLHIEWVSQSEGEEGDGGHSLRRRIGEAFMFRAGGEGQGFLLSNRDTSGAVTFHALEVRGPLPSGEVADKLVAGDRRIRLVGNWKIGERGGLKFLHDGDQYKGESRLTVPIRVKEDGLYEVHFTWRKPREEAAPAAAVEVVSGNARSSLGLPPAPPRPSPGEASFRLDQSLDSIAFQDLRTTFRFGPEGHLLVSNAGTTRRVVADAVKFEPVTSGPAFLIDNDEAEGRGGWEVFKPGQFKPYNVTGKDTITDGNKKKGELALRYRPSSKTDSWKREAFYRVSVGFPGKEGNETQAPVTVRAEASSPIVPLRHPYRAQVGAEVMLDATGSYDLQGGKLSFEWSQRGGPLVDLGDRAGPRLSFRAPAPQVEQEAWAGLARALLKHPDFLFTRAVTLEKAGDPAGRRRLLLVKVAADLVARAPSSGELEALERGGTLEQAIDRYLESEEFRSFYFHRVRLYLESDGTPEGDEPVRLWCHVAFNDLPFQEILTGDYTVDPDFVKRPRPPHHGKTGLLTMPGFIKGRPGLPHFNYAAHVSEKFLGYVFEVPPEIVNMRDGITAISTTSPGSVCYGCHKVLTPLAYQRMRWDDEGRYREKDAEGKEIDDSDRGLVVSYPYRGRGMEAFAGEAKDTERFLRTMINVHFIWHLGREMRYEADERTLYKSLWDGLHADGFKLKGLIRGILKSSTYGVFPPRSPRGDGGAVSSPQAR